MGGARRGPERPRKVQEKVRRGPERSRGAHESPIEVNRALLTSIGLH